jgi:Raf kinase inhibitor-like YbhB/YbcL family protein
VHLMSSSFVHGKRIPEEFAFCAPDAAQHVRMSSNRNPHLRWTGVPSTAKSLVLLCVDVDVPTRADDVNQEGRVVPAEIAAGAAADGIHARGKTQPRGPAGSRQGLNDYTLWFAGDADMGGRYLGYDGPCPPWNDTLLHHYHFTLYAIDLARCPVEGEFTGQQVLDAIGRHVLAEARITGTYSLNPGVK